MKTLKTLALFAFAVIFSLNVSAQKTENRNVKGFTSVDVAEGISVELTMDKKESVQVIADEDIIDNVVTELKGDALYIHIKGTNKIFRNKKVVVKVSAIKINSLESSSGSSITSMNLIESDELKMSVSSGASLKISFKAPNASCDASSGASAKLKGAAKFFEADASSGSTISASEVKAAKVNADVSSGASIKVHAEEELVAEASSGGSINYSGSPKVKDFDKSSGGSVSGN